MVLASNMFLKSVPVFILIGVITSALPAKVPCDLSDDACVTLVSAKQFRSVISGLPDIGVESLDPIHADHIDAILPNIEYTLSDAYFRGMKDCRIEKKSLDLKAMTSYTYLVCPRLTLDADYFVKGNIESIFIEGKGKCKVVHDDYHIGILSNIEMIKKNGKTYLNVKNFYLPLLEVRGGVVYKFDNLFYGDQVKSDSMHKIINANWKKMSEGTQAPAMKVFMGTYMKNINKFVNSFSTDDIFYKDV